MKRLLKTLAISTMLLLLLVACGKEQTPSGEGQATFTSGEDITLYYNGDVVNKIVISAETKVEELELLEGETVEEYYQSYKEGLMDFDVDLEYEIKSDSIMETIIVDLSKTSREKVESIWGTGFFIYNEDDTISYTNTANTLKEMGYTKK